MGPVRLDASRDLDRLRAPSTGGALGLRELERGDGLVLLGAAPGRALVELEGAAAAPPRPRRSTGLFHLAILVPEPGGARAVRCAGCSTRARRFTGASDHLVSEALYLDDPEGNGIEIYRDRPREEWRATGGELRWPPCRSTSRACSASCRGCARRGHARGTTMGHVHLQVRDIPEAEALLRRACSASSRPCAATRGRSSSRPAATTTTSA